MKQELRWARLRYYDHLLCENDEIPLKGVINFDIMLSLLRGRMRMRCMNIVNKDVRTLGLSEKLTLNRSE